MIGKESLLARELRERPELFGPPSSDIEVLGFLDDARKDLKGKIWLCEQALQMGEELYKQMINASSTPEEAKSISKQRDIFLARRPNTKDVLKVHRELLNSLNNPETVVNERLLAHYLCATAMMRALWDDYEPARLIRDVLKLPATDKEGKPSEFLVAEELLEYGWSEHQDPLNAIQLRIFGKQKTRDKTERRRRKILQKRSARIDRSRASQEAHEASNVLLGSPNSSDLIFGVIAKLDWERSKSVLAIPPAQAAFVEARMDMENKHIGEWDHNFWANIRISLQPDRKWGRLLQDRLSPYRRGYGSTYKLGTNRRAPTL